MADAAFKQATGARPIMRIASADLDNLMNTLEVNFVRLFECLVSPGYRLELGVWDAAGIHYNLEGIGKARLNGHPPIDLKPHTLIIIPPRWPLKIEVPHFEDKNSAVKAVGAKSTQRMVDGVQRYVAGEGEFEITLICGYFHASYGATTDLFARIGGPIIEQFHPSDQLDSKLKSAMTELMAQEAGSGAMSGALLKQVILAILRRSLYSVNPWVERFAILSDPGIARVFSNMAADPGGPHTVESLARSACLSRSAFMSRFSKIIGNSPMVVLRDLRMRQAAQQLKASNYPIKRIACNVGYESRSSFVRAFKKAYGSDPSEYRVNQTSFLFSQ